MIGMVAYVMIIDEEITSRRSVLVGVASSGGGIGTIFLPPLTSWIIDMYGWRGCFILMGGLCLQGLVVSALIYSRNTSIKSDSETEEGMTLFTLSLHKHCEYSLLSFQPHFAPIF